MTSASLFSPPADAVHPVGRTFVVFLLAVAVTLFAARPASGQTSRPGTLRLKKLSFTGLNRYTDAQLAAASGLHVGDTADVGQLGTVADRLAQSGAFDKVSYRYAIQGSELLVEFQVTETKDVFPCIFDNFVWFSQEELDQTLRRRVPFYVGNVPQRGTTVQAISAALTALLKTNGINATVEEIPFSEKMGGPVSAFSFRAKGISIPVRSLSFPGAEAISEKELAEASSEIAEREYSSIDTNAFVSATLVPLYHRHGYLNAHFGQIRGNVVGSPAAGSPVPVSIAIPVTEGLQYSWSRADWTGGHHFSTEELSRFLGMKVHEIANQDKINAGFGAVKDDYDKDGYIDARIQPTELLADDTRLASYNVVIDEGIQYHMGAVHFQGLPERLTAEFTKKWQLKPGQVYDATYVKDFLKKVAIPKLAETGTTNVRTSIHVDRNSAQALVDVSIAFQ